MALRQLDDKIIRPEYKVVQLGAIGIEWPFKITLNLLRKFRRAAEQTMFVLDLGKVCQNLERLGLLWYTLYSNVYYI